ncbi:ABC1-domain-containing protein [Cylindrobasidium torrendii FP15055 ss-10]|uniref:ABC1-domain-containing protein n=1 Tax=Cylindrobasidium torrendii FP15055 ss-10 TaxID=1314674 RepID=A0A0D7BQ36_9AGAR|nr:ABC1-domain-containing protein [Cylindrobasidium torrendii FP15055 ss-10]
MLSLALRRKLAATSRTAGSRTYTTQPTSTVTPSRWIRYARRTGYLAIGGGTIYAWDKTMNASALTRNLRTLYTCLMITIDYKLNFTQEKSEKIPELHTRVADRMFHLFTSNGGLYIKIGQAIGANAAFLPKPIQAQFAKLFDDAPQIPFEQVLSVFKSEFGRPPSGPDGVFQIFEETAVASASIAQVHKAKLWPAPGETEGPWVAVKIQKPDVAIQTEWDLNVYRAVLWMFEKWAFDLPVYFVADFICDHLRQELDFINEAKNSKVMAHFVQSEPRFVDRVYIPSVYDDLTTRRILTQEWIDGVRLSDREGIYRLMGEKDNTRQSHKYSILSVSPAEMHSTSAVPTVTKPLKGGVKEVMQTMVELFSAQMFNWGWVHCDPHPGNIFVRPNPKRPDHPQLVLLDHGLYVRVRREFRKEWSELWRSLMTSDYNDVARIIRGWGVGLPDFFASVTLMRPTRLKKEDAAKHRLEMEEMARLSQYEQSVRLKAKLRDFLTDTDRMPKELLFLMRNMRIVQGNNQSFGAPVNRIKITGFWASSALTKRTGLTVRERLREYVGYAFFRWIMFSVDVAFWAARTREWVMRFWGRTAWNFEDEVERSMQAFAKDSFGVDVGPGAFGG